MSILLCPVCHTELERTEHTYSCLNGHNFDRAKSGYVNLLLPSDKHSKIPGDNKLMVAARQGFLDKGYYQRLSDAVCRCLLDCLTPLIIRKQNVHILDEGCGEGYYTSNMQRALQKQGLEFNLLGVDISKIALDKAAKRDKAAEFAVASVFHLPVGDASCDALLNLFAPYCVDEMKRVVKPDGRMLLVVPGERHLMELKKVVYDVPYANEVKDTAIDGFTLMDCRDVEYNITLSCTQDIDNLFKMTPYYYKTGKENYERLLKLDSLAVTASFKIITYKRHTNSEN